MELKPDGATLKANAGKMDSYLGRINKNIQETPLIKQSEDDLREKIAVGINYKTMLDSSGWFQLQVKRNGYFDRNYISDSRVDMNTVKQIAIFLRQEDDHIKQKIWGGEEAQKELIRRADKDKD